MLLGLLSLRPESCSEDGSEPPRVSCTSRCLDVVRSDPSPAAQGDNRKTVKELKSCQRAARKRDNALLTCKRNQPFQESDLESRAVLSACGTHRALGLCSDVIQESPEAGLMADSRVSTGCPFPHPQSHAGRTCGHLLLVLGVLAETSVDSVKPFQSQVDMISTAICF